LSKLQKEKSGASHWNYNVLKKDSLPVVDSYEQQDGQHTTDYLETEMIISPNTWTVPLMQTDQGKHTHFEKKYPAHQRTNPSVGRGQKALSFFENSHAFWPFPPNVMDQDASRNEEE
jgi:hypothetical protein